ncbi:hypothetical protein RI367_008070 [Sorochytrium milnesiophthora]
MSNFNSFDPFGPAAEALRVREEELQRREQALAYKEAKLREREQKVSELADRAPNWPRCKPITYHDIDKDVPQQGRPLVKKLYFGWMLTTWTYIINMIGCFSCMVTKDPAGGSMFGMSFLIMCIGIPVSWMMWYKPLYDGVRFDRSLSFFFFFFNYGFHLAAMCVLCVGVPGWGGAGVITTISQFSLNVVSGIICIISTASLGFQVLYGLWQITNVTVYYRSKGLSMRQAQNEALRDLAASEAGQQLAKEGAKQAIASKTGRAI